MQISLEARAAIARAVAREAPISELLALGLSTKSINRLNEAGIITMGDLVSKSQEQLIAAIRRAKKKYSFGEGSLKQLYKALANYHKLEQTSSLTRSIRNMEN